jgi:hypothetical protein
MRQRGQPFAPNATNYFHSLADMIVVSPGVEHVMKLSDNEPAIVWIHQDRASSIVAITGFIAAFVVGMALAMA